MSIVDDTNSIGLRLQEVEREREKLRALGSQQAQAPQPAIASGSVTSAISGWGSRNGSAQNVTLNARNIPAAAVTEAVETKANGCIGFYSARGFQKIGSGGLPEPVYTVAASEPAYGGEYARKLEEHVAKLRALLDTNETIFVGFDIIAG